MHDSVNSDPVPAVKPEPSTAAVSTATEVAPTPPATADSEQARGGATAATSELAVAPRGASAAVPSRVVASRAKSSGDDDDHTTLALTAADAVAILLLDPDVVALVGREPDASALVELLSVNQRLALEQLLDGRSDHEAAHAASCERRTVGRWRKRDPLFRAAFLLSLQEQEDAVRDRGRLAAERAMEVLSRAIDKEDLKAAMQLLKSLGFLTARARGR